MKLPLLFAVLAAAISVSACATTSDPPITQLVFNESEPRGIVFRRNAAGFKKTTVLVRVDPETETFGEPFLLERSEFGPIYASNTPEGHPSRGYFEGIYLEPGYYALLQTLTETFNVGGGYIPSSINRTTRCSAESAQMIEVVPGGVHFLLEPLRPGANIPPQRWLDLAGLDRLQPIVFEDSVSNLEGFEPVVITSRPVAVASFLLAEGTDAWDCELQGISEIYWLEADAES